MKFALFSFLASATALRSRRQEPDAWKAFAMVAAAKDVEMSKVLCKVGQDGDSVTVRLHNDNSRSLAFNDDTSGYETKIKCRGHASPQCGTGEVHVASVDQCPECPCEGTSGELSAPYARVMAAEVDSRCSRASDDGPARALLLGFGGGELAEHVQMRCGQKLQLDAVELDGRLPQLSSKYFGLPSSVQVTVGDALLVATSLKQAVDNDKLTAASKQYDVIMVDCFSSGGETPEHCRSQEFIHSLHGLLRGGGKLMHHFWRHDPNHDDVAPQHDAAIGQYKQEFSCQGCSVDVQNICDDCVDDMLVASVPKIDDSDE